MIVIEPDKNPDVSRVLNIATKAGRILLENGAEISRVEETMSRISHAFGVDHDSFFVLSNGIFTTGWDAERNWPGSFAKVLHIPMKGTRLDRVVAVNELSREICDGQCTPDEADAELDRIRMSPGKSYRAQLLGAFFGAGCFSIIFGGTLNDALVSAIAGLFVWLFQLYIAAPHLSKITGNLGGAAVASLCCLLLRRFGLGDMLSHMVIGAIIPLIPGVAFTNGVRDIADGDYISGIVRLLDSMLGFLCIAAGVGIVFLVYRQLTGGMPL